MDGECKKCTDGGGGPYKIKRKCDAEEHSCNGVEDTKEEKDCSKHCSGGRLSPWFVHARSVAMQPNDMRESLTLPFRWHEREMQFSGNALRKRGIQVQKEIINQAF